MTDIPHSHYLAYIHLSKFFQAVDKSLPPLTGDHISRDFLVALDIHEEDGKGSYSPVPMDKDCFKLRQNMRKRVSISVSQPQHASERAIIITR